jgi:hypothetical protein
LPVSVSPGEAQDGNTSTVSSKHHGLAEIFTQLT